MKFLRIMTDCGFLRPDNAPTEEAAQALPADVPHMSKEEGEKRIVWFHDEPTTLLKIRQYSGVRKESCPSNQRGEARQSWCRSLSRSTMVT